MTSESATSSANPPPREQNPEHQPPPESPVKSEAIPSLAQVTMEDVAYSNGVVAQKEVDETEEPYYLKYLDSEEYAQKYRTYEADFRQHLLETYFSQVYEERTAIDGETIMSSKWPCTRFYADQDVSYGDMVQYLAGEGQEEEEDEQEGGGVEEVQVEAEEEEEEEEIVVSASAEIASGAIPNGGIVSEKEKNN